MKFQQKPPRGAGKAALREEVLPEEHRGGAAADAADGRPIGGQKQRMRDAGVHPVIGELDGARDLREETEAPSAGERLVKLRSGQDAQRGGEIGESFKVGPGIERAVRCKIQQLVRRGEGACGETEDGDGCPAGVGEEAVGGMEAVVEQAPVQVEFEAGVGVGKGEVLPEGEIGGEPARSQGADRVGAPVAELGEKLDLLGKAMGGGEQVEVPDLADAGAGEQELGERDAFEDGRLAQACGGEGLGDAADLMSRAESFEGVGGGAGLQLCVCRDAERRERLKDKRGEAVVVAESKKFGPIERSGGEGLDGLEFGGSKLRAGGKEQKLHVRGKIAKRQHTISLGKARITVNAAEVAVTVRGPRPR